MSYFDIYLKRLNRFGTNLQDRIQGQREHDFEKYYLNTTTFQVKFSNPLQLDEELIGSLHPHSQDNSETLQYLLVEKDKTWPAGTIFEINNQHWMIMYKYNTLSEGYNKFLLLKLTHFITWIDREGVTHSSWGYFFGQMERQIYDVVRSTANMPSYSEPSKETHLIMPKTDSLKRIDYLSVENEGFYISGYDIVSTPGVEYFTLTETYIRPSYGEEPPTDGTPEELYWLEGRREQ